MQECVCLGCVSMQVLTNGVIGFNSSNLSLSALNPSKSTLTCCGESGLHEGHESLTRKESRVSGSQGGMFHHKQFPPLTLFVATEHFRMASRRFCCIDIRIAQKPPNTREKDNKCHRGRGGRNYTASVQLKEAFGRVPAVRVARNCLVFLFCPYVAALK